MKSLGVIIARFQSPYLHEGHKNLIDSVRQHHNKVVIVLGISPVLGGLKNPLDFHTRERMIKNEYPQIVILPLPDHPMDTRWSENLDGLLRDSFPGSKFKLYGSRDSFIKHYSGNNEIVELPESSLLSATSIREQISDKVLDSAEFRTGIIYAYSNMYPKVYATVDIAVFRHDKKEMLLGKKEIDKKWRLLGGFTDPTDENYEAAAGRELREECGDIATSILRYENSFRVNDWRYRNEGDKIMTCLFSADFISGSPRGKDDIAEVNWFPLEVVTRMMDSQEVAEEHYPQLTALLKKYFIK